MNSVVTSWSQAGDRASVGALPPVHPGPSELEVASWLAAIAAVVLTLLGAATKGGRRTIRWVGGQLSRRPTIPRTRVLLEPHPYQCLWAVEPDPAGGPTPHVFFKMTCAATSVTPDLELHIVRVDVAKIKGEYMWSSVSSWEPARGHVEGATLRAHEPKDVWCNVVIARPSPPPGPLVARMVLRDNYGQNHRTAKIKFQDVALMRSTGTGPLPITGKPAVASETDSGDSDAVDHGSDG